MKMHRFLGVAPLIVAAIPVAALARDCNEVKAEIDAKIKAKGVANYMLQIVDGSVAKEGKIVGSCGVGAKSIVYFKDPGSKGALDPASPSPKQAQPLAAQPATPSKVDASRLKSE